MRHRVARVRRLQLHEIPLSLHVVLDKRDGAALRTVALSVQLGLLLLREVHNVSIRIHVWAVGYFGFSTAGCPRHHLVEVIRV